MARFRSALPLLILALLASADLAAQSNPRPRPRGIGPEVRVDTLTGDSKPNCPVIAVAPDHSAEVAWSYTRSTPYDTYARHFTPDLTPTDPGQVEIGPAGSPSNPSVVYSLSPVPGGFQAITALIEHFTVLRPYLRRLDASGKPVSPLVPVGNGGLQWLWPGPGGTVYAGTYQASQKRLVVQRYQPDGQPAGPAITVNSRPVDVPSLELAPAGGAGDFVAVWTGFSLARRGAPARQVVRGRVFRHNRPQGQDFDVNVNPGGTAGNFPIFGGLTLAVNPATRGFTAAWTVETGGNAGKIQGRTFDAQGRPASPERSIFGDLSFFVSLAYDDAGNVLALWNTPLTPRSEILGRLFRSDLTPIGVPFEPWSEASGDFNGPICARAVWAGDSWRIAWTAETSKGGPRAVFVRRFTRGTPGS